jgi:tetratricopeptide (TPR) repeat protein
MPSLLPTQIASANIADESKGIGMAEGLLRGVLGGEEEETAASNKAGPEAFAAAVAANIANQNPEVAAKTAAFFGKQIEVLEVQKKTLEAEYEYFELEWRPRLLGVRLRIAFQIFIALAATVVGVGVAIMIDDAVTSRRVVIEPFDAPPALAARGITGKVVANGLLDELSRLQDATRSSSAARGLSGAWTRNIKLDVPETGVSVGEISRLLRERFGHDVHIDGDLVETPTGGVALTVRGNGVPPKTFNASAAELAKLTVEAAEYVYSKSQPARWAAYLNNMERYEELLAFCRTAFASADATDRPRLLQSWALAIQATGGSTHEALALFRASLKLQPDFWTAHTDLQNALMVLGDEESAWRAGEDMRTAAGGRPGRAPEYYYENWDYLTWNLPAWLNATMADAEANAGVGTGVSAAGPTIADIQSRLHDSEASDLALKTTKEDPHDPSVGALIHYVRGRLAADAGDAARAATEMEAFGTAYANPAVSGQIPGYNCWIAPAEQAAGRPDKADAVLKTAGTFVDCYRFRADILDGRGDWPGAQKAYADAVALAPDLPAAYYSWGVALATHGDLNSAAAKLKDANLKGPHWADPLKAWGDVLAKQGKIKDALVKYDKALKYAPNWAALKVAREAAAKRKT